MKLVLFLIFVLVLAGCSCSLSVDDSHEVYPDAVSSLNIPERPMEAPGGMKFFQSIANMSFSEREPLILQEFAKGNIPDFLRHLSTIRVTLNDSLGTAHEVTLEVMSDYLSIGTNEDFIRTPMGPQTAQKIADQYGCILPTRKIVDIIYTYSVIKLEPITYYPVGNNNELVTTFERHNREIEEKRFVLTSKLGEITAGLKKDVVITNLLPSKLNYVAIYGWHKTDGKAIQPLYTGHVKSYVDYSHGIRLVNSVIEVDGRETTIQKILADPLMYKMLSDETGIMNQPKYQY